MRGFLLLTALLETAAACEHPPCLPRAYHVDSGAKGNDANSGLNPEAPWQTLHRARQQRLRPADSMLFVRGGVWRGQLNTQGGNATHRLLYGAYGDPALPKPRFLGSLSASSPSDWTPTAAPHVWSCDVAAKYSTITRHKLDAPNFDLRDIGNAILDSEKLVGTRVWAPSELRAQNDWYYNASIMPRAAPEISRNTTQLLFFSPAGNPATVHNNWIELAWMNFGQADLIAVNNIGHLTIENLDVRYTGSSAIGGGNMSEFVLRGCEISWAGGCCIVPGPRFKRNPRECTRYGNHIDIWEQAENVEVYNNRLVRSAQRISTPLPMHGFESYVRDCAVGSVRHGYHKPRHQWPLHRAQHLLSPQHHRPCELLFRDLGSESQWLTGE